MSTVQSIHLFDSTKFFYLLHINPDQSVPNWKVARHEIDDFFLDFHEELLNRVNMELDFDATLPFSDGIQYQDSFRGFSKKDHFLLTGHYLLLCFDVKEKIELERMDGNRREGLIILHNEINMFIALLNVIQKIIGPNGVFSHQDNHSRHWNGSKSISTTSSSGRSTPTDSGISSDDEVESKKEIQNESTGDFEAYSEEIHKMAAILDTSDLPRVDDCDRILDVLNKEKARTERLFDNFCEAEFMTEFPLSSTIIDPSEFYLLDAYQNLLKRNQ